MQPTNLLSALRHWWLTLLVAVLLAGGAGYLFSSAIPVTHEARVRMLVGPTIDDDDGLSASGHLTRTYGELVTSEAVIEGTINTLDLPHTPDELRAVIRPTADSATRILIVRVRDLDPDRAALIANELGSQLGGITTPEEEATDSQGALLVVDRAQPGIPIGISTFIIVGLAGFAGLVTALTLVLLLENLNRTVRNESELAEVVDVDYLGHVMAPDRRPTAAGFVVESAPDSVQAADYRMLATKLEIVAHRDHLRSVLVLGVGRAQGAGELAGNVAKVLAERRHSVTLVDANSATREITTAHGLNDQLGLTDMLEVNERSGLDDMHPGAFTSSNDPRLFVVPFGRASGHLTPRVAGAQWVLDRLLEQADFVLVNAAPADRTAASLMWAGAVDATVLVVPRNRIRRDDLSHLIESLRLVGGKVIGVVFEEPRPFILSGSERELLRRPRRSRAPEVGGSSAVPTNTKRTPPTEERSHVKARADDLSTRPEGAATEEPS